jgi:hypothetical protein
MNKRLDEAILRLKALPDDQQGEIADLLIDVLDRGAEDIIFSPEQIAEIEHALSDDEPYASEEEVRVVLDRLTK